MATVMKTKYPESGHILLLLKIRRCPLRNVSIFVKDSATQGFKTEKLARVEMTILTGNLKGLKVSVTYPVTVMTLNYAADGSDSISTKCQSSLLHHTKVKFYKQYQLR